MWNDKLCSNIMRQTLNKTKIYCQLIWFFLRFSPFDIEKKKEFLLLLLLLPFIRFSFKSKRYNRSINLSSDIIFFLLSFFHFSHFAIEKKKEKIRKSQLEKSFFFSLKFSCHFLIASKRYINIIFIDSNKKKCFLDRKEEKEKY